MQLKNKHTLDHFYENLYFTYHTQSQLDHILLNQPLLPKANLKRPINRCDIVSYLPDDILVKVDRASMYHSLEAREPFLDHHLIEYALSLPESIHTKNNTGKYLLKKILSKYIPEKLTHRPKKGFGIPLLQWLNNDLKHLFDEYLEPSYLKKQGLFNVKEVEKNKRLVKKGYYYPEKLWFILLFQLWHKTWQ